MKYLAIKNFEQFQHYKDRAPLWIKMHTSVLSDFALLSLPEAAQGQLFKLWILASRLDNRLPNDKKFIAAQIFSKKLYLSELIAAGFLFETDEPATPLRADWQSRYVPADVRTTVLAKTDGRCAACGSMEDVEIDHIVPISKGGAGEESNLQALCRKCNRKKRTRSTTAEQLATQMKGSAEPREEREQNREERETTLLLPPTAAEAEAEAALAVMLDTDADRNALTALLARATARTACLAALTSMLTGNDPAVPRPSTAVFGQALRDLVTNGVQPSARKIRTYIADADRAVRAQSDVPPSGAGAGPRPGTGARAFATTLAAIEDL